MHKMKTFIEFCFFLSLLSTTVSAQTFTVDDNGDTSDAVAGDGNCDDGTGKCTLRAAIEESNATGGAGAITIDFSAAMTIAPVTLLPTLSRNNVSIDASTVAGASCGTLVSGTQHTLQVVLDGSGLPASGDDCLTISGTSCTVKGLNIQNCPDHGIVLLDDDSTVDCCYIGTNQAGTAAAANGDDGINIGSSSIGIAISNNLLSGNSQSGLHVGVLCTVNATGNLIGTNAAGTVAIPNTTGISGFGSRNCVFGGAAATDRNIISGNSGDGFNGGGTGSTNNTFKGNYIGLDITGELDLGNGGDGLQMFTANNGYIIGGTASGEGNVVSGNGGHGIILNSGTTVEGNFIGTDKDGDTDIGNDLAGINLRTISSANTIGGTTASAANIIAFNGGDGVDIPAAASQDNAILRNSIFSNTGLGIDLESNGVTANDVDDPDAGCNNLQNFPVITSASVDGSNNITVSFSVNSTVGNSSYPLTIQFFKADAANEEGQTYLGETTYTSGEAGTTKMVTFASVAAVTTGDVIVSTATDSNNNTSEFSASAVLPVELVFFRAEALGNSAKLIWQTETEINNEGFEIQYFINGEWTANDFVRGYGNSFETRNYQFMIHDLFPGSHLFRLKQKDFNGRFSYSAVAEVRIEAGSAILKVFPNPVQEMLYIGLTLEKDETVRIELRNIQGKMLAEIFNGYWDTEERAIINYPMANLPTGYYIIRVIGASFSNYNKILVVDSY